MAEKSNLVRQFSAGGIVFRKAGERTEVLVTQHSGHKGWAFPKGMIEKQEKSEDAAQREVEEEAGVKGKIIQRLKPISYFFRQGEDKIFKTVTFFLMEYQSGDIKNHDWEVSEAVWLPKEKVEGRLSFKTEKQVWGEAQKFLKNG